MPAMPAHCCQLLFITLCLEVTLAARRVRPCQSQIQLLDYDGDEPYSDLVSDDRITGTSSILSHPPIEARMSGDGWCASSMCGMQSPNHYLQIDFGAEVVVEAIAIDGIDYYGNSFYITEYYVEYGSDGNQFYCAVSEESIGNVFNGVDICRERTDPDVKNFMRPVIARFIRIVPLEWEGASPCLKLELYGCLVNECSRIRAVSNNDNILSTENIIFSSFLSPSYMDISRGWCAERRDLSPSVTLNFTKPVYLLYAIVRGQGSNYVTGFSFMYSSSSNERITYTTIDRISRFGLDSPDDETFLLWTPINTSKVQLSVDEYHTNLSCIGIDFYGCTYNNEVIHHVTDSEVPPATDPEVADRPTSCMIRPVQQTPVVTVTTTIQVSTTIQVLTTIQVSITTPSIITSTTTTMSFITITATPLSSCSVTGQQQTSASSSSDSDVVNICIPVVVVVGVIILIVVVMIGILIWRKTKNAQRIIELTHDKVAPNTAVIIENDLYGMESTIGNKSVENNNETSDTSGHGNRKDKAKYEYPTTVIQPNQPTATYETVSLHEESESVGYKENSDTTPVYSEVGNPHTVSDPQLQRNPAYNFHSETTDHS